MSFKDSTGNYFHEKKKKRDRLTGRVVQPGSPVTLVGQYYNNQVPTPVAGPFIAETIWICNGETVCAYAQLYDGLIPLTCRILLAPGTTCQVTVANPVAPNFLHLDNIWMPFFTAVNFDASSVNVVCTVGGWIP